ncbi:MAG: carbonic anhydrase [Rhodoblastus sp.]
MSDQTPDLLPLRLEQGYRSFLGGRFPTERQRFRALAETGQKPRVMLIGCCDSRVAPETIFDASPGEIFVLRNVAALVPPYRPNDDYHSTSAALEFGVMGLRVEHIVVMGHEACGGVKAYAENEADPYMRPLSPGDFIGQWIKLIAPAAQAISPAPAKPDTTYVEKLGHETVKQSLINLRTFPCISNLIEKGRLSVHGAYFGVADGRLLALDEARGVFEPIAEEAWRTAFAEPRF